VRQANSLNGTKSFHFWVWLARPPSAHHVFAGNMLPDVDEIEAKYINLVMGCTTGLLIVVLLPTYTYYMVRSQRETFTPIAPILDQTWYVYDFAKAFFTWDAASILRGT
jgi:hypothetical protein